MTRVVGAACALALAVGIGNTASLSLCVRTADGLVWRGPIQAGEMFDIAFEHSSEHCTWTQHFTAAQDARIHQVSSTFPCYGPGMPTTVPLGTALTVSPEGFTVAAPLVLRELRMMASKRAGLSLQYRNKVIPLGRIMRDFDVFTITIEP